MKVVGIDNSSSAIVLARINQRKSSISEENLIFIQADLFKELPTSELFDLIISNPPYISFNQRNHLDRDVLEWEDHSALFANDEGLSFYKRIFDIAPKMLKRNSLSSIVLEIDGESQALAVKEFAQNAKVFQVWTDMVGNTRSLYCKYDNSEIE